MGAERQGQDADPARRRGRAYPLTQVDLVIKELRAAKVPFQLEVYGGTGHGYSTPKNKDEERANAQSLVSSALLEEVFNAE